MWPFNQQNWKYSKANVESDDDNDEDHQSVSTTVERVSPQTKKSYISALSTIICVACGFLLVYILGRSYLIPRKPATAISCQNPRIRREWRTLSHAEKHKYLDAVTCLRHTPSRINPNLSLYDDFPYVHDRIASYAHMSAPFLAFHRYFILLYEAALREDCRYNGTLTYWNWSLDWEHPSKAPIWSANDGFGSDSGPHAFSKKVIVGEDRCVTDGPFAQLNVHFFASQSEHCLSRSFSDGTPFDALGKYFTPDAISEIMKNEDYESFLLALEKGPHNAIPQGVGGDFYYHVAPYEPVFFLHHTQLDRLWWMWQQANPSRLSEYNGAKDRGSKEDASLDDVLSVGGLGPDIRVRDIMDTKSGMLCYSYQ